MGLYRLGIVILDAGYGKNTSLLLELESHQLKYLGELAKNRKVTITRKDNLHPTSRLDELAQSLHQEVFTEIQLNLDKPKIVWVAIVEVDITCLGVKRSIAIVMNYSNCSLPTEDEYFITNVFSSIVSAQWIVVSYSQRNWLEVFDQEAKGWSGLIEYQVRDKRSLIRHFIFVFCAYTFILWHQMTGGLRRRWANKPLNTFTESNKAFRTAMSCRFFNWLTLNRDIFAAYKASLGLISV